jgi:phosphate transport system substrate-binding protein
MKTWLWFGSVAAASLVAACGKGDTGGTSGKTVDNKGGSVTLNASGSSFQRQYQELSIDTFTKSHDGVKINYAPGGSGKGRQDFADQVTDFGCTDAPFSDDAAKKAKGGDFVYVPILLGAITVSYNLDGVDKLQLSADTLAKIFQRDIKKWNDPAIAADNPGVTLPDADITVAHRSDGSGTTEQFTKFVDTAASSGTWHLKSGSTVEWPPDTQGGTGNNGVVQIVKTTNGAIGYIDLSDAKRGGLKFAAVKNQAGKYVAPSAESAQAAGEGIDVKDDLTFVSVNAKGDASYPITAPSWCVAYIKQSDKTKAATLKQYFKYLVTDGQAKLSGLNYAPLPKALADKASTQVEKIQTPS